MNLLTTLHNLYYGTQYNKIEAAYLPCLLTATLIAVLWQSLWAA